MPTIKGPDLGRRTAAAIAAEIAEIGADLAPRLAALEATRMTRSALVEAGDVDAIEAHDAKVRRAETEVEVYTVRRARLAAEHEAAEQAEAHAAEQAKRRAAYDEASDAAAEAGKIYREDYPRLAREIAALLSRAGQARALVRSANAALPDGQSPISTDFEPSRGRPGTEAWSEPAFKEVRRSRSTGRELLTYASGDPDVEVVKVPAGNIHHPFVPAVPHVPLSANVILPGVAWGDPWFWPAPAAAHSQEGR